MTVYKSHSKLMNLQAIWWGLISNHSFAMSFMYQTCQKYVYLQRFITKHVLHRRSERQSFEQHSTPTPINPRPRDNDPYLFTRNLAQAHHHAKNSQPQTSKRSRATADTSTQSPASSHQPAVTSQQSQASSHKPTVKKRGPAAGGRRPLNICTIHNSGH